VISGHDDITRTERRRRLCAVAGDEVTPGLLTDPLERYEKEICMMKASTR